MHSTPRTPRASDSAPEVESPKRCPVTGRFLGPHKPARGWQLGWLAAGLGSLIWFLVRVLPKPSRAAYPCQRAAFPVASSFVVWLLAVVGSRLCWKHARSLARTRRGALAAGCAAVALLGAGYAVNRVPMTSAAAAPAPHGAIGQGRGVHPGRVVWVHAPEATHWSGYNSATPWWDPRRTDLAVAEAMTAEVIRSLAGEDEDRAAWEALFRYFNSRRGKGNLGYVSGEKIAIKINLTTSNARGSMADDAYEKKSRNGSDTHWRNTIDNSPQLLVALLRQLVYVAGVAPGDIRIGDPTGLFANHLYEPIHAEFPEVVCFDNAGRAGSGRTRSEFSNEKFFWSTSRANGKVQDFIPTPFATADYLINYAVLKTHSAGVTLCAKNNYGSLLRCPDGYLRGAGKPGYFNLHDDLPGFPGVDGMGRYRPLVDLMGHRELGGKTLLYLVDGLFSGEGWESRPFRWRMAPFNGDWPNSLFASQDPVAIDSVCYDFLVTERPDQVAGSRFPEGAPEDYLHEAALAGQAPSGTFYDPERDGVGLSSLGTHEHWNNPVDKQYSRNLGLNRGIELVAREVTRPPLRVALKLAAGSAALSWRDSLGGRLEACSDLGAGDWRPVGAPTDYRQGRRVLTVPADAPARFYRLVK